MRVLLFGANGMLGQAIRNNFSNANDIELLCAARSEADFCFDFTDDIAVEECFAKAEPEIVINAAAMVNLQKCEESPSCAYLINSRFCSILAQACQKYGSYLVQVSTDHYYTGDGSVRHKEDVPVRILNEYARSKYVGECLTRVYEHSVVLRTNIVGFRGIDERPTFLEWAVRTLQNKEPLTAFKDFYTSSLHTEQFAEILRAILELRPEGIFNVACAEVLSKAEFLENLSRKLFGRPMKANIGSVHDFRGAKRADSLGLDTSKLEKILGYTMPSADEVMESIDAEYRRRTKINEIQFGD